MILVFEQDPRDHGRGRFNLRASWFRGRWQGRVTWRLAWGFWSLSYYPSPGLREFTEHIESGATTWFQHEYRGG
jgi:hypothetical protein